MAWDDAYYEAEKRIKEVQRTGATELYLNDMQLTELPETIGQLIQLKLLNLSNNQLTELPETIGQLIQLQSLDIVDNQLFRLPESLGNLVDLQSLNLFNNHLSMLPESFGQLKKLSFLTLGNNNFAKLPDWLGQLTQLQDLQLSNNQLISLPDSLGQLAQIQYLTLTNNELKSLPPSLSQLNLLTNLYLSDNDLVMLPEAMGNLIELQNLELSNNHLTDIPSSLSKLNHFNKVVYYNSSIKDNPLNRELVAAYNEGSSSVKAYLRAKAVAQITLNEAKLILVGEGEVGKSCLLGALRDDPWAEGRPTTHGIEIKTIEVTDPQSGVQVTFNGWDFGGQQVYRPTHQLFFTAPAVYLVVWKPREGPNQGFVKEWIRLVKHREPDAKILVVATHGGPQQRQPDIDRQELWDLFGKETIIDFFHVESKPDENGERQGIDEIRKAIARIAVTLPEVGRSVPKRWQEVRDVLSQSEEAYLPLERVLAICQKHKMDNDEANLFVTISHRLGHLIHYQHDPTLRDIVVLKPDWLAIAISFVLDDKVTRNAHGLVQFSRLSELWNDLRRPSEFRYPPQLHPIFLRLMERFDLSYRVSGLSPKDESDPTNLIAQLVPDTRPVEALAKVWLSGVTSGDIEQKQICRIVESQNDQSASAEGLFYRLIVRLHRYSLGRDNYNNSVHWQRGLVLDDDYNGMALLEHKGNDVHITVRAPYPERFLAMLAEEVKYLVKEWRGLRCDVMVPCITPCGKSVPGKGLFEVEKLIEFKRQEMTKFPCMVSGCNQSQDIDMLLRNAPTAQPDATDVLFAEFADVKQALSLIYHKIQQHDTDVMRRHDQLDAHDQRLLSLIDDSFTDLMHALTDEAKEGPRLFSLVPVDRSTFNPRTWVSTKFRLILWCEHSRLPLPNLNGQNDDSGVYEIELTRTWFQKTAPFLKVLTSTLSLVLPVASSGIKLALDETAYKAIEEQLDFSENIINASLSGSEKIGDWLGEDDATVSERGQAIRAKGAVLRELHALLKAQDPSFGGLIRVRNKRQEFLWVHPQFEEEY